MVWLGFGLLQNLQAGTFSLSTRRYSPVLTDAQRHPWSLNWAAVRLKPPTVSSRISLSRLLDERQDERQADAVIHCHLHQFIGSAGVASFARITADPMATRGNLASDPISTGILSAGCSQRLRCTGGHSFAEALRARRLLTLPPTRALARSPPPIGSWHAQLSSTCSNSIDSDLISLRPCSNSASRSCCGRIRGRPGADDEALAGNHSQLVPAAGEHR